MTENNPRIVIATDEKGKYLGIETNGITIPAKGVCGHEGLDVDCATAILLMKRYGINIGRVVFKSSGENSLVENKTAIEWLKRGWVLVDIGGAGENCSPDNLTHLDHNHGKESNECATSIVWRLISSHIKVSEEERERIVKLIKYIKRVDLNGGQQFFDLSHICKDLNVKRETPETILKKISSALTVYIERPIDKLNTELFEKLVLEIFEEKGVDYETLEGPIKRYLKNVEDGKTQNIPDILRMTSMSTKSLIRSIIQSEIVRQKNFQQDLLEIKRAIRGGNSSVIYKKLKRGKFLLAAETDSTEFKSAALQAGATIIVKMNSSGQFQIFTQKRDKVNIAEIVEALRIEEHFLRNGETLQLSRAYLQQEGTIPEVSNLFFFMKGGMLLNGSNTANDQPSSVIPFERNVELNVKTFR